jgi:hypothetical protein
MILLLAQYCSGDKTEKNEKGWSCSTCGERRSVDRCMVGKPEGKRPLGIARTRRDDNIKMDLQEFGCGDMDWIELAQDRKKWRSLVNGGNFLTSGEPVSFSGRALLHGVSKYVRK